MRLIQHLFGKDSEALNYFTNLQEEIISMYEEYYIRQTINKFK